MKYVVTITAITLVAKLYSAGLYAGECCTSCGCDCSVDCGCESGLGLACDDCGEHGACDCDGVGCDSSCDDWTTDCYVSDCKLPSDDACDCSCDCLQCCRKLTVLAEVLFLRRSDAGSFPLITNQTTGATLVDADNLEFDHRATPRFHLVRETCSCWGWDIGYLGVDSWNATGMGGGPVSPVLHGPGLSFPSTAPGTVYQVNYGTDLDSGEFNIRRRCNECVTWLAGFRWVELGDELQAFSVAPTTEEFYNIDTNNHMYGFQIGADLELIHCQRRFHVDGIFRAGILFNDADHSINAPVLTPFAPGVLDTISAEDDETSFIGEIGIRGVLDISSCWSVYGGYHALVLDAVALAPDQIPTSDLIAPGSSILNTGTLYFHGAVIGLQASF